MAHPSIGLPSLATALFVLSLLHLCRLVRKLRNGGLFVATRWYGVAWRAALLSLIPSWLFDFPFDPALPVPIRAAIVGVIWILAIGVANREWDNAELQSGWRRCAVMYGCDVSALRDLLQNLLGKGELGLPPITLAGRDERWDQEHVIMTPLLRSRPWGIEVVAQSDTGEALRTALKEADVVKMTAQASTPTPLLTFYDLVMSALLATLAVYALLDFSPL